MQWPAGRSARWEGSSRQWWRTVPIRSSLDNTLCHHDGAAADRSGGRSTAAHRECQLHEARTTHLVALLDAHEMVAVGVASGAGEQSRKGSGRGAGRRVFGHAEAGREHAGMEVVAWLGGLAGIEVGDRAALDREGRLEADWIWPRTGNRPQRPHWHPNLRHPARPAPPAPSVPP